MFAFSYADVYSDGQKKKKKEKMSNTVGALARIKATHCTSRHCGLHCQLFTVKERREGRKEDGRKGEKREERMEGRKEWRN